MVGISYVGLRLGSATDKAITRTLWLRYILIYLSWYLDQETAKWPFLSSSQATTCYYQSSHSKVEAISLRALPKDTTGELVNLSAH